jgi:adenine-specific DNA methylase
LENTYAKYIIISYNNCGIIPLNELDELLEQFGEVMKIPINHKTYNKLKGLSNYKRTGEYKDVNEFLWVIKTNIN